MSEIICIIFLVSLKYNSRLINLVNFKPARITTKEIMASYFSIFIAWDKFQERDEAFSLELNSEAMQFVMFLKWKKLFEVQELLSDIFHLTSRIWKAERTSDIAVPFCILAIEICQIPLSDSQFICPFRLYRLEPSLLS